MCVHIIFLQPAMGSGFKWGSTNAYTEDSNGKPIYNWNIVDSIFDTYINGV